MSKVTSQKFVRQYALDIAQKSGRVQFSRVSKEFLDRIEAKTINLIRDEVHRHPSIGITLK